MIYIVKKTNIIVPYRDVSWGPASDEWLRMAVVAALGNSGSGKASECPGVQLFAVSKFLYSMSNCT